jgi:DNA-binding transcriptional MocR family regulator
MHMATTQNNNMIAHIQLDKDSEEPLYQQLTRHFQQAIQSGQLPAGTRLPPSRDLARELSIGRISVVSAYNELQAKNLISAHPGRGTFVNGNSQGAPRKSHPPAYSPSLSSHSPLPQQNVREIMRLAERPGLISLHTGTPPTDFLPVEALRWAIDMVLQKDGVSAITYDEAEGYMPLRAATRDYVTAQGIECRAENILITGGAQQAIDLVIQALLNPGDLLLTTNPTYMGVLDIAHVRRVMPLGVPSDHEGIRLDVLEDILIEHRPKLLYLNPSFSNPNGCVMPIHRRRQLLRLAQEYHLTILEDGVYHELHFDTPAPPPLKALDESGSVIHASGFSKILLPGTRIGYLIVEKNSARERIIQVKQAADICTPSFNQRVVYTYIKHGKLPGHLDRIRHILRSRRDAAVEAARRFMPDGTRWRDPSGGLYLWLELPPNGPASTELYVSAIQNGVSYAIGTLFYTQGEGARNLRINFSAHSEEAITEGFRRLGKAYEFFQSHQQRQALL